jgi:hypothetical protein
VYVYVSRFTQSGYPDSRNLGTQIHALDTHACMHSQEYLLLVKMKEKNLLKIQPLPKVLRVQATRSKQLHNIYICYILYKHNQIRLHVYQYTLAYLHACTNTYIYTLFTCDGNFRRQNVFFCIHNLHVRIQIHK